MMIQISKDVHIRLKRYSVLMSQNLPTAADQAITEFLDTREAEDDELSSKMRSLGSLQEQMDALLKPSK